MSLPVRQGTHAPFSLKRLDPVGFCDRCSFKWPLASLTYQQEWAGDTLVRYGIKVCPRCLDEPQQQFRVIHIGAEPKPLKDPRPGNLPNQVPQSLQFILDDDEAGVLDIDYMAPGEPQPVFAEYDVSLYDEGKAG
jgi:hypothetical protein